MKTKGALALQAAWGEKPCDHPAFAREYDADGRRTGNSICTQCGQILSFREKAELRTTKDSLEMPDEQP